MLVSAGSLSGALGLGRIFASALSADPAAINTRAPSQFAAPIAGPFISSTVTIPFTVRVRERLLANARDAGVPLNNAAWLRMLRARVREQGCLPAEAQDGEWLPSEHAQLQRALPLAFTA